jgi:hypothetical protein
LALTREVDPNVSSSVIPVEDDFRILLSVLGGWMRRSRA